MSEQQNLNTQTNVDFKPVSFADISLTTLKLSFNDTYKVSKGSASQVVIGFESMRDRLQEPSNEYQQALYPTLTDCCTKLYTKYSDMFLTTFQDDVERQVFGANLNGNRNNGSLYRAIPSGVNRNLTYNYAQFGQLMRVLNSRLKFISQRDVNSVQRYQNTPAEASAYQKLQNNVNEFMTFLIELSDEWNKLVTNTRTKLCIQENTPHRHQQDTSSRTTPYTSNRTTPYTSNRTTPYTSNRTTPYTGNSNSEQQYKPVRQQSNCQSSP